MLQPPSSSSAFLGNDVPRGFPKLCENPSYNDEIISTSWASKQLSTCFQSHQQCQEFQKDAFLPTRLISVSPEDLEGDIVLVDSSKIPLGSRYVALSYCWGNSTPKCQTTTSTLNDRKERIPWSTLPKTFQDAVQFTRTLGLTYLWIDSICIIQGDNADWTHEAGKMFHVYKNSYVTLGAVSGESSASGLFSSSGRWDPHPVAELRRGSHSWTLCAREAHSQIQGWHRYSYPLLVSTHLKEMPLFQRAWAYQERLIAPRVLYFLEGEIIFQCFRSTSCMCGGFDDETLQSFNVTNFKADVLDAINIPSESSGPTATKPIRPTSSTRPHIDDKPSISREMAQKTWYKLLEDYSALSLTDESDRLPAVGAIAEMFHASRPNEEYLAGLWSGTFLQDLLWIPLEGERNKSQKRSRIPSWSWASISGSIYFPPVRSYVFTNLAEVKQTSCKYVGDNPYGVLESSELILRGRVLSFWAFISRNNKVYCWINRLLPRRARLSTKIHPGHFNPYEGYNLLSRTQKFYLLEIGQNIIRYGKQWNYLILRVESRRAGTFRRVGSYRVCVEYDRDDEDREFIRLFNIYSKIRSCKIC